MAGRTLAPTRVWRADRLDVRLAQGRLSGMHLDALASALAAFHAEAPCAGRGENADELAARLRDGAQALRSATSDPGLLQSASALEQRAARCVASEATRLLARADEGRTRILHGALALDAIHAGSGGWAQLPPRAASARAGDVGADLAALAVALAAEGGTRHAERLIRAYVEAAGDHGVLPLLLLHAALFAFDGAREAIARSASEPGSGARAVAILRAALRLAGGPPCLVVVGGTTGSSPFAARVADALEALRVRGAGAAIADGPLVRADAVLASGRRVVIDGGCDTRATRSEARRLATRHVAAFLFVECRADDAAERSGAPREGPVWEPPDELPPAETLVLLPGSSPEGGIQRVMRRLHLGPVQARNRARDFPHVVRLA
jgi:hypothetical protein